MAKRLLNLQPVDNATARKCCEAWHYSRSYPASKNVNFGVWDNAVFVGVIVYGHGANYKIGDPYGLKVGEAIELLRVALKGHVVEVSRMVAVSLRLLRQSSPGVRLVVSYADPEQDHHGGIYQAGGWVYTGQTSTGTKIVTRDGRSLHKRSFTGSNFGAPKSAIPAGARMIQVSGKHKYLMPLDDAMRLDVKHMSMPYPKRPSSIVDAPVIQTGDGSSNLTGGLQESR